MFDYPIIQHCQICNNETFEVLSLGNIPLVDALIDPPHAFQPVIKYPAPLFYCPLCTLVQLGTIVSPELLFPADYPYASSSTRILRDNFKDLALESQEFIKLKKQDLVIDIGCNDGNLLSNFKDQSRTLGITPENRGEQARQKGIEVIRSYFTPQVTEEILGTHRQAKIITATNVLAHFQNVHEAMDGVMQLLDSDGIFISESGYFFSMLQDIQYDSIHHEHLRYYTLKSLEHLFKDHGLEIIHVKLIPTHGGSIRVYAARPNVYSIRESVVELLQIEKIRNLNKDLFDEFAGRIKQNKLTLQQLLNDIKTSGKKIFGIGAPGRATVLMNYTGIDSTFVTGVVEVQGSPKMGKIIPGTNVLIIPEDELYKIQPDYALMLSWHIASELMPKLKANGFRGDFILPLPHVTIIKNRDV